MINIGHRGESIKVCWEGSLRSLFLGFGIGDICDLVYSTRFGIVGDQQLICAGENFSESIGDIERMRSSTSLKTMKCFAEVLVRNEITVEALCAFQHHEACSIVSAGID
jgi:hypothetical protein